MIRGDGYLVPRFLDGSAMGPEPPEWIGAAVDSLQAFRSRKGRNPEMAIISPAAARHMRAFTGDASELLGFPARVGDLDGIDWA